jgi:Condensation domain
MTEPGQRGDTAVLPRWIGAEQRIPGARGPHPAWFTGGLEAGTAVQSTAVGLRLRGDLDGPALEGALQALTARFPSRGTALPHYLDETVDGAKLAEVLEYAAHEPFDLTRGPLLRVGLYRQDACDVVVLVVAHHVVTDACPMTDLIRDLEALYRARAGSPAGASAAGPGVTCGDSVRLYRWVSGARRPAPRQHWC